MINPNDWPNPPLQIVDADYTRLPTYGPYLDGPRRPPWVIRVVERWAGGYVPIGTNWHHVHNPGSYRPTFDLDGIEWAWRNDGVGVWTLIHLLVSDMEVEELDNPQGRVRDF